MVMPSDFGFELNPLDVNIAEMLNRLQERMKEMESDGNNPSVPIMETYVSLNPEREYGEIKFLHFLHHFNCCLKKKLYLCAVKMNGL